MAFIIAIFTKCTHTYTHIYIYILISIRWISSVLDFTKRGQEIWEIWVEIQLLPEVKS